MESDRHRRHQIQMTPEYKHGDEWPNHYRGYRLQTNPDGDVWWQAYQGTDRLFLDPVPEEIVDALLELKHLGGRVRIIEGNDVITKVEKGDSYNTVWIGKVALTGELVPADASEYSIPVVPDGIDSGDLWPSVYDGAKYSFGPSGERIWWSNPSTHKRHPVQTSLPTDLKTTLARLKPRGGSFRVTPWDDVITLVDIDRLESDARSQFEELPRVIKNLISLRKDRGGVEKIPVYVDEIDSTPIKVSDPPSLTDPISADEVGFDEWTQSLGPMKSTDPDEHSTEPLDSQTEETEDSASSDTLTENELEVGPEGVPDDDPADW